MSTGYCLPGCVPGICKQTYVIRLSKAGAVSLAVNSKPLRICAGNITLRTSGFVLRTFLFRLGGFFLFGVAGEYGHAALVVGVHEIDLLLAFGGNG